MWQTGESLLQSDTVGQLIQTWNKVDQAVDQVSSRQTAIVFAPCGSADGYFNIQIDFQRQNESNTQHQVFWTYMVDVSSDAVWQTIKLLSPHFGSVSLNNTPCIRWQFVPMTPSHASFYFPKHLWRSIASKFPAKVGEEEHCEKSANYHNYDQHAGWKANLKFQAFNNPKSWEWGMCETKRSEILDKVVKWSEMNEWSLI